MFAGLEYRMTGYSIRYSWTAYISRWVASEYS